jgi:hypothetical protein
MVSVNDNGVGEEEEQGRKSPEEEKGFWDLEGD